MGRLLLILLLVVLLLLWWKQRSPSRARDAAAPPPAPKPSGPEPMLRCAECGLHLPGSQALPGKGGVFCSAEHRGRHESRSEAGGGERR